MRVPRAGLGKSALELLRAPVADEEAVARFHAKVKVVPGSPCMWWTPARSLGAGGSDGSCTRWSTRPCRS